MSVEGDEEDAPDRGVVLTFAMGDVDGLLSSAIDQTKRVIDGPPSQAKDDS